MMVLNMSSLVDKSVISIYLIKYKSSTYKRLDTSYAATQILDWPPDCR